MAIEEVSYPQSHGWTENRKTTTETEELCKKRYKYIRKGLEN